MHIGVQGFFCPFMLFFLLIFAFYFKTINKLFKTSC